MVSATALTARHVNPRALKVLQSALLPDHKLDRHRGTLQDAMVSLEFNKREIIYGMGDPPDGVYLVEFGRLKIYRLSEDGREITLAILHAGDIFGEEALLGPDARETFAEALEPTTLFFVDVRDFRQFAKHSSELAMRLFEIAGSRLAQAQRQVEDLAFRGVTSRIANLLVSMAEQHGIHEGSHVVINPRLTHQPMASLVGTTRETFTATLSKLSHLNLIRSSRRDVRILDVVALQSLV